MVKFDNNEIRTRELFDNEIRREWTSKKQMVRTVFEAMWHASLPRERVEKIAEAMCNTIDVDLSNELTTLVRRKVLRSYTQHGRRFYEVNY